MAYNGLQPSVSCGKSEPFSIGKIEHFSWEKCLGLSKPSNCAWLLLYAGGRLHSSKTRKTSNFAKWKHSGTANFAKFWLCLNVFPRNTNSVEERGRISQISQIDFRKISPRNCQSQNFKFRKNDWGFAPSIRLLITVCSQARFAKPAGCVLSAR